MLSFRLFSGLVLGETLTNLLFLKLAEDMGEPFDYRTNEMGSSPNFLHCKKNLKISNQKSFFIDFSFFHDAFI